MQYFPALEELAKTRHWRLLTLTKAECTPGEVQIRSMIADREYSQCDAWREETLRRIEMGDPRTAIVVMSGDTAYVPYGSDGEELSGEARGRRDGGRLRRDPDPDPPRRPAHGGDQRHPGLGQRRPGCVSEDLQNLESCAFRRVRDRNREFDARAARAAPGGHLIDINGEICPGGLCRAVIGNALVYRDKSHLTATFARTLAPGIGRDLKKAGLSS